MRAELRCCRRCAVLQVIDAPVEAARRCSVQTSKARVACHLWYRYRMPISSLDRWPRRTRRCGAAGWNPRPRSRVARP